MSGPQQKKLRLLERQIADLRAARDDMERAKRKLASLITSLSERRYQLRRAIRKSAPPAP